MTKGVFYGSYENRNRTETYALGKFQSDGLWGKVTCEKQIHTLISNSLM